MEFGTGEPCVAVITVVVGDEGAGELDVGLSREPERERTQVHRLWCGGGRPADPAGSPGRRSGAGAQTGDGDGGEQQAPPGRPCLARARGLPGTVRGLPRVRTDPYRLFDRGRVDVGL